MLKITFLSPPQGKTFPCKNIKQYFKHPFKWYFLVCEFSQSYIVELRIEKKCMSAIINEVESLH